MPRSRLVIVAPNCIAAREAGPSLLRLFTMARQAGVPMGAEECYRTLADQVKYRNIANQPGNNPACVASVGSSPSGKPVGRSMHGWGKAVDLSTFGGSLTFGSAAYAFMKQHAASVGWNHPAFAEPGGSSCPEPWHWEWVGDGGNLNLGTKRGDAVGLLPSANDNGFAVVTGLGAVHPARFVPEPRVGRQPPAAVGDRRRHDHTQPARLLDGRSRRRHLQLRRGQVPRVAGRQAAQRADQRHGLHTDRQGLLPRRVGRRDLHLRRREVPRLDRRDAPQQAGRRHDASRRAAAATTSSRPTAGSSPSATRKFRGSTGNLRLVSPIVGMAPTPSGRGYWLVASDGGVFTFGDARFFGSLGGQRLTSPVIGLAPTKTGRGYRLALADRTVARVRRRPS